MEPLSTISLPDCPKGVVYVVDPAAASTLASHPAVAQKLAEGHTALIGADTQTVENVKTAMQRVGRIDL